MIGVPKFQFRQCLNESWAADLIVDYYDNHGFLITIFVCREAPRKASAKVLCCQDMYAQLSCLMFPRRRERRLS